MSHISGSVGIIVGGFACKKFQILIILANIRKKTSAFYHLILPSIVAFWADNSKWTLEQWMGKWARPCSLVGHRHLSLKVQNVEFKFDIKFWTLCNHSYTTHRNFTSNTHLCAIIRPQIRLWCNHSPLYTVNRFIEVKFDVRYFQG